MAQKSGFTTQHQLWQVGLFLNFSSQSKKQTQQRENKDVNKHLQDIIFWHSHIALLKGALGEQSTGRHAILALDLWQRGCQLGGNAFSGETKGEGPQLTDRIHAFKDNLPKPCPLQVHWVKISRISAINHGVIQCVNPGNYWIG